MAWTEIQMLNDVAERSFRDTADREYIVARMAFHAGLHQPFLWSALHSLEKYTKGILLYNRLPAKDFSHSATKGLERFNDAGMAIGKIELSDVALNFIKKTGE